MSMIGYSEAGLNDLSSEIKTGKKNLLDLLDGFNSVDAEIDECWKGADADAYREELKKAIATAKSNIEEVFDAFDRQCHSIYEEWVAKQNNLN